MGTRGKSAGRSSPRGSANAPLRVTIRVVAALCLLTAVICCIVMDRAPIWFALCYIIAGATSFLVYRADKRAAIRNGWRVAEGTLHLIDLACGIAGGLIAQALLRHKTSKRSFTIVSGGIYAGHLVALLALIAGYPFPV
jgi:uncharacterized membrane protein YsdA (DUF1294 family)